LHFVGIRPGQIQQCRLSRTAHRHIHHCPYKQIILLFRVVYFTTLLASDTLQRRVWLLDDQVDTICQIWGSLNGFLSIKGFFFLYRVDWLVIKPTDILENQAEMIWFAVQRGCSSTTFRNSANRRKFTDDSVVHAWLTEDSELRFHEGPEVNFIHRSYQGCPQSQSE